MKHFTRNLTFVSSPLEYHNVEEKAHILGALQTIMSISSVYRLFTEDDVRELIVRTSLMLRNKPIVDNFFTDDSLFSYTHEGAQYEFKVETLSSLVGFEHLDTIENFQPREKWLENRDVIWRNAMITAAFTGANIQLFEPKVEYAVIDGEIESTVTIGSPEHTKESLPKKDLEHSEFLADEVLKLLGTEPFNKLRTDHRAKLSSLKCAEILPRFPISTLKNWTKRSNYFYGSTGGKMENILMTQMNEIG